MQRNLDNHTGSVGGGSVVVPVAISARQRDIDNEKKRLVDHQAAMDRYHTAIEMGGKREPFSSWCNVSAQSLVTLVDILPQIRDCSGKAGPRGVCDSS